MEAEPKKESKMLRLLVAAAALSAAPAAQAQDPTGSFLVRAIFDQLEAEMGLKPFVGQTGQMGEGESRRGSFTVSGGAYAVIGICDENCSDVDLVVRDVHGQEMGSDLAADDKPVVVFEGEPGARYEFEVLMPSCSAYCHWGVRAYEAD